MGNVTTRLRIGWRGLLPLTLGAFVMGMTGAARAQEPASAPQANDRDINRTELNTYDKFMDGHPRLERQVARNPSLATDPNFIQQHPAYGQFLQNHPGVKEEIGENPKQFLNHERAFERRGGDVSRAEAASFDRYLDAHPDVARQLRKNPSLVDDKQFVQQHPELGEYLQNHPRVREDIRQHPRAFVHRERQFERHEGGPAGRGR